MRNNMEEMIEQTQQVEQTNQPDSTDSTNHVDESSQTTAQAQPAYENNQMRMMRLAKERIEQENSALQAKLKQYEQQRQQIEHDPEDLVPRKYVDERVKQIEQQLYQTSTEYKLKNHYPDFDKVVNDDTIALLKDKNPVLASAIGQVTDIYSQAAAAYEAIKNLGIYTADSYTKEKDKAQENAQKPRTIGSLDPQHAKGNSPLSYANAFAEGSKEYYQQLWKEVNHYRKQNT